MGWRSRAGLGWRWPRTVSYTHLYHAIYSFNWLSASGTSCMVATLLSALALRVSISQFAKVIVETCRQLFLPTVTVVSVLAMAFVLNYSGATSTYGMAFAATGFIFPFFSAILGLSLIHIWSRALAYGLDPAAALDTFDSFTLFEALGDSIRTGPTGNNLRDIRILMTQ